MKYRKRFNVIKNKIMEDMKLENVRRARELRHIWHSTLEEDGLDELSCLIGFDIEKALLDGFEEESENFATSHRDSCVDQHKEHKDCQEEKCNDSNSDMSKGKYYEKYKDDIDMDFTEFSNCGGRNTASYMDEVDDMIREKIKEMEKELSPEEYAEIRKEKIEWAKYKQTKGLEKMGEDEEYV